MALVYIFLEQLPLTKVGKPHFLALASIISEVGAGV